MVCVLATGLGGCLVADAAAASAPKAQSVTAPEQPLNCTTGTSSAANIQMASGSVNLATGVLARVGGQTVTVSACEAEVAQQTAGGLPIGTPPQYAACVAALRKQQKSVKLPKGAPKRPTLPTAALHAQCVSRAQGLVASALNTLINDDWVSAEAAAAHLTVSPAAVAKAIASQRKAFRSQKAYAAYLSREHLTAQKLAAQERMSLLTQKVQQYELGPEPVITHAQVAAYFREHQALFDTPARHDVDLIETKTASVAQTAKQQLQKGMSWAKVTAKYSTYAGTKHTGGVLDGIVKTYNPPVDNAIATAHQGQLVGPIQGSGGWYLVEVTQTLPAIKPTLASVAPRIKLLLAEQKRATRAATRSAANQQHYKGLTACRPGYVVSLCGNAGAS